MAKYCGQCHEKIPFLEGFRYKGLYLCKGCLQREMAQHRQRVSEDNYQIGRRKGSLIGWTIGLFFILLGIGLVVIGIYRINQTLVTTRMMVFNYFDVIDVDTLGLFSILQGSTSFLIGLIIIKLSMVADMKVTLPFSLPSQETPYDQLKNNNMEENNKSILKK